MTFLKNNNAKNANVSKAAIALAAAVPAAVSYAAAVQVFKFGFNRYEGKNYWYGGEIKNAPYADRVNSAMNWIRSQDLKKVMIRSNDRLRLVARILECDAPRGVIILMHGYHSCAIHDFSCAVEYYHNLGFNLIMPDHRAHGDSDGKYITFGIKEKDDCRLWAEFAARRYKGLPILLDGMSMGASTVMLAAGGKLPDAVSGIIADCGYSSPMEICKHILKTRMNIPAALVLPLAKKIAEHRADIKFEDGDVGRALIRNTKPLLIIHGEADDFVPVRMTDSNAESAKNCDLTVIKVPKADHGMSFITDETKVKAVLEWFLDKCINNYKKQANSTNA